MNWNFCFLKKNSFLCYQFISLFIYASLSPCYVLGAMQNFLFTVFFFILSWPLLLPHCYLNKNSNVLVCIYYSNFFLNSFLYILFSFSLFSKIFHAAFVSSGFNNITSAFCHTSEVRIPN